MAFYEFIQNNSGGSFDFDEDRGITHCVLVEAESVNAAISKAEEIGIYFYGCDAGIDCECCGDRWYKPWRDAGTAEPTVYGEHYKEANVGNWMPDGKQIAVHFADGRIDWA